ncbi:DUF3592 domain-containing protein [Streptomyces sp. SM11]|uniref:DUF3592 domain-containing protein n=1 Tax=Streptomyces sp. SM11 TaxID=565557 RepID=UPI000CD5C39D|nr:DUF3592 domain-containing protein [Streptomyces sp. SM11]
MTSVYLAASGSAYFVPHALVALGVSGALAFFARRLFSLRVRGVTVRGVCVKHTFAKDGIAVVARFQTESGETFRCLSQPAAVAHARIGDPLDVVYDPRNPKNAEVPPIGYGVAYAMAVLSAIVAVPGIGLLGWIIFG